MPFPRGCRYALPLLLACSLTARGAEADPATDADALPVVLVQSAAGFEQAIADAPASISVVTRQELEKGVYTDITDAVRNIPGLYVTGGANMRDVSVRGMTPAYTLFLVDGRPISAGRAVNSNGNDGGKQIGLPPLAMIDRIEVVRGPMSSLYGSEAMGGVINVITRPAPERWLGSANTDYTASLNDVSNDAFNSDVYLGGPLVEDVLGVQLTGSWQHTEESDHAGGLKADASMPESTRRMLGGRLTWQAGERDRLAFGLDSSRLDYTHTPGRSLPEDGTPTRYIYDKDIYTLSHAGRYGNLSVDSWLQHDVSDRVQEQTRKEKVSTLNSQATWFGERHIHTFGLRYRLEDFVDETNGLLTASIPGAVRSVERWIGALFGETEWNLGERFALTTGLRYDKDELFGSHFSPRLYGNWHVGDGLTLKGGISTGYVQPALSAVTPGFGRGTGGAGSPAPHPRALIIGNPDLKPETSVNYEAGVVYEHAGGSFNSSLMAFRTDYRDKIAEDRWCDSGGDRDDPSTWTCSFGGNEYLFLSTMKNIDRAEIRGVELSLDYRPTGAVRLSASHTWTDSEQKTGEFRGQPLNKIPRHMANVSVDGKLGERLTLWARANYRGETSDFLDRTAMRAGTPAYATADAGVLFELTPKVGLKAGLYNLTNRVITNETYGVVLDGRRLAAGLNVTF